MGVVSAAISALFLSGVITPLVPTGFDNNLLSVSAQGTDIDAKKVETIEKLKSLNLEEDELNGFIQEVEDADAIDILAEAGYFDEDTTEEDTTEEDTTEEENTAEDPLAKQKEEAKDKLKTLKDNGKLTEEALNDYTHQVDQADSLEVIEDILAEAGYFDEDVETGNVRVTIQFVTLDRQFLRIPNAKAVATNTETKETFEFVMSDEGETTLLQLPSGDYELKITEVPEDFLEGKNYEDWKNVTKSFTVTDKNVGETIYFNELEVEDPKPEDPKPEDPKPEDPKPGKPAGKKSELPETGEAFATTIFGVAALSVLAGLGLVAKRRED